ncbi:MAG: type II secretion system F family protein [Candidatus Gastranaerophilales bacterium]|nr:type II secretion system F family protein [Candidatus Gastranaerophilales bacterium]
MKETFWEGLRKKGICSIRTNLKRRDYHKYAWKKGELALTVLEAAGAVCFLAYFFYRSIWAVLPLSVVGVFFFKHLVEKKAMRSREELTVQFKECILSVSASLKAGYAVENAFLESRADMRLLYGEHSFIYQELELIRRGMVINITLEEQLADLAERSGSEEIGQFAQIFAIAKRSGGNLPEIIRVSVEIIGRRIDVRQEMQTVLSGRRMEQNIMKAIPFVILTYIEVTYPGYFDSLYHNLQGVAVMTGCLTLYLAAYVAGDHILAKIQTEIGG